MNVKGFILEDDQGREFVMVCESLSMQPGKAFYLRGWQRRRLVPLQYTEREIRRIVGGVLVTLDHLFKSLPRFSHDAEEEFVPSESSSTPRLKKTAILKKVRRGGCEILQNEWP